MKYFGDKLLWDARARRSTRRGAALITALLVMLVLSGLGIVALNSVNDSVWKSGNHRIRQQSNQLSDSVANLAIYRLSDHGQSYLDSMQSALATELSAKTDAQERHDLVRRGGYRIFTKIPPTAAGSSVLSMEHLFPMGKGIFHNATTAKSFEDQVGGLPTNYEFIIRDPLDGPPAPGFDRSHCFKKVTVAAHGQVGNPSENWDVRHNVAMSRNVIEAMVGPVPCGTK
ncbi:MAG: hypothetical protein H0U74_00440 [Bradymonadaceae bacterium]|nr:hypothetical protein [Lujinxingiaceae bacterium]